jgi:prepilin-type N-terminal cleavage/methylation domain-containing protein
VNGATRGWTLIELLAVVAIIALIASMVVPTLRISSGRDVRREAVQLGDAFEFARERAILTGRPHRVVLDLTGGRDWVEWAPPPQSAPPADPKEVPLEPPPGASGQLQFQPVPAALGRAHTLPDDVAIQAVALPDTTLDHGTLALQLDPDGSADPAVITLVDADGHHPVTLEVQPLADTVRVTVAGP